MVADHSRMQPQCYGKSVAACDNEQILKWQLNTPRTHSHCLYFLVAMLQLFLKRFTAFYLCKLYLNMKRHQINVLLVLWSVVSAVRLSLHKKLKSNFVQCDATYRSELHWSRGIGYRRPSCGILTNYIATSLYCWGGGMTS